MPWKNGGGTTREIAASAPSDPDWRLSVATIQRDGAFSDFAGYDRTIVPIEGNGIELTFDNEQTARLDRLYEPYAFRGELRAWCRLLEGAARDFNVMTKRERVVHRLETLALPESCRLDAGARRFVYVLRGAVRVLAGIAPCGDTIRVESESVELVPESAETLVAVVTFEDAPKPP
jgi:environmental stress-induced protein Ves